MSSKKFFILDASSYVFRAYHAINYLENSKGFPTNAIFGFVNMINRLFENIKPEYFAAVFDSGGKTFRNDIFLNLIPFVLMVVDELKYCTNS